MPVFFADYLKTLKKTVIPFTACLIFTSSCGLLPVEEAVLQAPVFKPHESKVYETAEAERMDLNSVYVATVNLIPAKTETYSFNFYFGTPPVVYVEEGQHVNQGDVLAKFVVQNYENELKSRQDDLMKAELSLSHWQERQEIKSKINTLSKNETAEEAALKEKEALELNIEIISKQLKFAQDNIDRHTIYAGFDGVVSRVYGRRQGVTGYDMGTSVLSISDSTDVLFEIQSPESSNFEEGEQIVISSGELEYDAIILLADELALTNPNPTSKYARLTQDYSGLNDINDIGGNANYSISKTTIDLRNVLCVPFRAVKRTRESSFVYILDNGVKAARKVELGANANGYFQILSGIDEGDMVILE